MADVDELPRSLALAKAGLVAPEGARARVRARLGQSLPAANAGSAPGARPARVLGLTRARAWTVGLMSVSFVAGYWLGGTRSSSVQHAAPPAAVQQLPGESGARAEGPRRAQSSASAAVPHAEPGQPSPQALSGSEPAAPPGKSSEQRAGSSSGKRAGNTSALLEPPPRTGASKLAKSPDADSLALEVALLQRVERAIRAREGELALALLVEHEHAYPASAFREERTAARVLAACVAQQGSAAAAQARAEAQRYLSGRALSVYADRIRTLCEVAREADQKDTSAGH